MKLEAKPSDGLTPRIAAAVSRHESGVPELATSSTDAEQISVFAEVSDLQKWEARDDVIHGAKLRCNDGSWLVTGRIVRQRLAKAAASEEITALSSAVRLRHSVWDTIADMQARPADLCGAGAGGEGVLIGIIDYGCDFVHRNFRDASGATRIEAIWDQAGSPGPSSPFNYGHLYTRADIDSALRESDPYAALGYAPAPDTASSQGSHGTHVMDIAAGNGLGSKYAGVAPEASLAFVHVDSGVEWSGPGVVGNYFGDSVNLAEAISWLFELAGDRPCVINVSLGTNGGPHDGTSLVERWIDNAVDAGPGRAVVIAASNSHDDGIHASGTVTEGGHVDLTWRIPSDDFTHNELEVWYAGADEFTVEILTPDGHSVGEIPLGETGKATTPSDPSKVIFYVSHVRASNGDNTVGIFMERGLPTGPWTVRLKGVSTAAGGDFHAWIERDDRGQSSFDAPRVDTHTIGSIATGQKSIVVGSYNARSPVKALSYFSSAGPTRDGREKPEVSAPGHGVWAAHSRTVTKVTRKSGTSMAAPAVSGMVALLFSEAAKRGHRLKVEQTRMIVEQTARAVGGQWHNRYGHGRVDALAALKMLPGVIGAPDQPPDPDSPGVLLLSRDPDSGSRGGAREEVASLGHDGMVEGFIELVDPSDVPESIDVRAREDKLITGSFPASKMADILADPRVKRVEVSKDLRMPSSDPDIG